MQGELLVQGSKNTALPVLAATLLGKGVFVLHHCPKISDVEHMLLIDTRQADQYCVTGNGAGKMRSTITLLGSILGRMHRVEIPYPGG